MIDTTLRLINAEMTSIGARCDRTRLFSEGEEIVRYTATIYGVQFTSDHLASVHDRDPEYAKCTTMLSLLFSLLKSKLS